jgi:hypothetical protein
LENERLATPSKAEIEQRAEKLSNGLKFDTVEAMRTTAFVSGSRGTGKSDVAMMIAEQLQNEGVTIAVFDSSLDWIRRSSISHYVTVQPYSKLEVPEQSMIFDISQLTPLQQQETVENFNKRLFESQLNSEKRFFVVFEESQLYFPLNGMRSKKCQNSMRLLTVGRNLGISVCAISQFPATCDKELIKNSGQIYVGYCAEPNTLSYWLGLLGNKTFELKNLQNGQFLYYNRNKISKTQIEPFEGITAKTEIINEKPISQQLPTAQPQTVDYTPVVNFLTMTALGIILILIGAS